MTTKTKTECKTKDLCHYDSLARTKFFHGMLLTDEHLRAEQTYHREALKRINRHLYGPGIVCGLEVVRTSGLCIKVQPGLALDCYGNAIDVCRSITIDLSDVCKKAYPDGCAPDDAKPITKHLVLRYAEIPAEPEPVLTPADDCTPAGNGTKCEASKYREGFCLEFRDECPDSPPCPETDAEGTRGVIATVYTLSKNPSEEVFDLLEKYKPSCMKSPPCQDCGCDDGALGLATLEIDCAKNTVDIRCDCRQYVWSPRLLQWLICELLKNVDKLPIDKAQYKRGLPSASVIARNPLAAAWDVSEIALRLSRVKRTQAEQQPPAGQGAEGDRPSRSRARRQGPTT